MYARWTGRLLEKAGEAGLKGSRLLDIGCGTGLSSTPQWWQAVYLGRISK
jgi:ubiquinone/menaquinone biosynthesis C-methylase UbiE